MSWKTDNSEKVPVYNTQPTTGTPEQSTDTSNYHAEPGHMGLSHTVKPNSTIHDGQTSDVGKNNLPATLNVNSTNVNPLLRNPIYNKHIIRPLPKNNSNANNPSSGSSAHTKTEENTNRMNKIDKLEQDTLPISNTLHINNQTIEHSQHSQHSPKLENENKLNSSLNTNQQISKLQSEIDSQTTYCRENPKDTEAIRKLTKMKMELVDLKKQNTVDTKNHVVKVANDEIQHLTEANQPLANENTNLNNLSRAASRPLPTRVRDYSNPTRVRGPSAAITNSPSNLQSGNLQSTNEAKPDNIPLPVDSQKIVDSQEILEKNVSPESSQLTKSASPKLDPNLQRKLFQANNNLNIIKARALKPRTTSDTESTTTASSTQSLAATHSIRQMPKAEKAISTEDKPKLNELNYQLNGVINVGFKNEKEIRFPKEKKNMTAEEKKDFDEVNFKNEKKLPGIQEQRKATLDKIFDLYAPKIEGSKENADPDSLSPELRYLKDFVESESNAAFFAEHPQLREYSNRLIANPPSEVIASKLVEIIEAAVLHEMEIDALAMPTNADVNLSKALFQPPTKGDLQGEFQNQFLLSYRNFGNDFLPKAFDENGKEITPRVFDAGGNELPKINGNAVIPEIKVYDSQRKEILKDEEGNLKIPLIKIYGEKHREITKDNDGNYIIKVNGVPQKFDINGKIFDSNLKVIPDIRSTDGSSRVIPQVKIYDEKDREIPQDDKGRASIPKVKIYDDKGREITRDTPLFIFLKASFEKNETSLYEKQQILNLAEQWLNDPFINSRNISIMKDNILDIIRLAESDPSPLIQNLGKNLESRLGKLTEAKPVSESSALVTSEQYDRRNNMNKLFSNIRLGTLEKKDYPKAVEELATTITAASVNDFRSITSAELNNQMWTKIHKAEVAPNITFATQHFNQISDNFINAILGEKRMTDVDEKNLKNAEETLKNAKTQKIDAKELKAAKAIVEQRQKERETKQKEAARVIEFLIHVETKLMESDGGRIVDFNGALAVQSALQKGPIDRLLKENSPVAKLIPKKLIQQMESNKDILKSDKNYANLRHEAEKLKPLKIKALPYLGVYQTDVLMVDQGNSKVIKVDGEETINQKYIKVSGNTMITFNDLQNNLKEVNEKTSYDFPEVKENDDRAYTISNREIARRGVDI